MTRPHFIELSPQLSFTARLDDKNNLHGFGVNNRHDTIAELRVERDGLCLISFLVSPHGGYSQSFPWAPIGAGARIAWRTWSHANLPAALIDDEDDAEEWP